MNILFVCRYNRFRSRVAEEYFNQINKNKNIHTKSAGIIKGSFPLDKEEVKIAKQMGINLSGRPRGLSTALMKKIDWVVIVADNVPKKVFSYSKTKRKITVWKIKDITSSDGKVLIEKRIKEIKRKVEKLVKKLKKLEEKK
jgi:protein-tyrosine-phosphatase